MTRVPLLSRAVITLCLMALMTVLSILPGDAQPGDSAFVWLIAKTPTLPQKILHVLLYGILTLLWAWTLDRIRAKTTRLVLAVAIASVFGATLEWYQTQIPGRFGTLLDAGLNAAGALLGMSVAIFLL